jgi:hypothetical protein
VVDARWLVVRVAVVFLARIDQRLYAAALAGAGLRRMSVEALRLYAPAPVAHGRWSMCPGLWCGLWWFA